MKALLDEQRQSFIAEHGREPGPDDPLFPDMPHPEHAEHEIIQAMKEVTGPVIATTLVLLAVFVPTAFLPGITGELYRQFGLTISTATVFSSINALTLSPALCALLLRPAPKKRNIFFRGFNKAFEWGEGIYGTMVAALVRPNRR